MKGFNVNSTTRHQAKAIANDIPASWVLAELFDVEAHSLDVPEHVYENQAGVEYVTCEVCEGQKYVPTYYDTYTPCHRCYGEGEILDYVGIEKPVEEPELVILREAA